MKILYFLLLFPAIAFGRLGDNEAQINQRYGQPYKTVQQPSARHKTAYYTVENFWIKVDFIDGLVQAEMYQTLDHSEISIAECRRLLSVNGGEWRQVGREDSDVWQQGDFASAVRVHLNGFVLHTFFYEKFTDWEKANVVPSGLPNF